MTVSTEHVWKEYHARFHGGRSRSDHGGSRVGIRVSPKEESREFIRNWVPGRNIEEYVVFGDYRGS